MIGIILIFITSFFIHIFLGMYILMQKARSKANKHFVASILFIGLVDLCGILIQLVTNETAVVFIYKISMIMALHHIFFTALFIAEFSESLKMKKAHYIVSYIVISMFSVFILIAEKFADFIFYNNTWRFNQVEVENVTIFSLYWGLYLMILIISVFILIRFYIHSDSYKKKKQAIIILTTYCISAFLLFCYVVIIIHTLKVIKYTIPAGGNLFFIIWGIGVTYAIIKYRFLVLTPNLVSSEIITNIDEIILLLDSDLKIISNNIKNNKLLISNNNHNRPFLQYIHESEIIKNEISQLLEGKSGDFSCRFNFKTTEDLLLVDGKFKIIKDSFNDVIGIMVIAKEVKEVKQLQRLYKITERETEIVQLIISGMQNKDIAKKLDIAETTLKRHITNIYNKLSVNNKVELINLLKDFNIIPEKDAERRVVIF